MRRLLALLAVSAVIGGAVGCGSEDDPEFAPDPAARIPVSAEVVVDGLSAPLGVVSPPRDPRLYVVERTGYVRRIDGGRNEVALDVSREVSQGGERGLLGLAFHPLFAHNGRAFVSFTDAGGDTRVVELGGSPGRARLDVGTRRELLRVRQPEENHNGGHIVFGGDGLLYVGLGDGGGGGDPRDNGQDATTLLGAILRIDVDGAGEGRAYSIPPDNPFADGIGGAPEVFVYGVRNPWRFSVEAPDDDLWVADVGQDRREEVTVVPGHRAAGANLGWPLREGSRRNRAGDDSDTIPPTVEYDHETGCSVIGGLIYRGTEIDALLDRYVFGDYCTGRLYAVSAEDPAGLIHELTPRGGLQFRTLRALGSDSAGELYAAAGEAVYRLRAARPGSPRR